jgi:transcriptional regulator with XRE-family HTH domain
MDIGKRIRDLREERGLTQREVARRAGLTPSGVGFIEHGQTRNPSAETVLAVARALGVPVEELLREPVPLDEAPREAGPEKQLPEEAGVERHPNDEVTQRRIYTGIAAARATFLESTAELWDRLLDQGESDVDTLRQIEQMTLQEIINHAFDEEEIKERCAPEQRDRLERAEQRLLEADRRVSRAIDAKLPSREIDKRRAAKAERQAMIEHLGIPKLA